MSAFTESALLKKLAELNSSQQSIQTLSLWLIHHRKHYVIIIKTWFKELQKVPEQKKLTFLYLGNDVIQNSKKKGPEYGKEFGTILGKVFAHIGETCSDQKLYLSLLRILRIWEERGVYDAETIKEFSKRLLKNHKNRDSTKEKDVEKRKKKEVPNEIDQAQKKKLKKSNNASKEKEKPRIERIEMADGKLETHITLSPHIPPGEPPEPEELIKALKELENSPSSDAATRERIANLPSEISELSTLSKLEDKEAALKLAKQVNEAVQLLNDYNSRLATEMEDRKKIAIMLKNFQAEQRELLVQSEARLEEFTQKLNKYRDIQKEIRDHLLNLPDLSNLPDVTGLAPLPSAGDLFNVH